MKIRIYLNLMLLTTAFLLAACKEKTLPVVSTKPVTDITETTAVSGGTITSDGNASITQKGVCWDVLENPTVSDASITYGPGSDEFTSNIVYLTTNTTYHIRPLLRIPKVLPTVKTLLSLPAENQNPAL